MTRAEGTDGAVAESDLAEDDAAVRARLLDEPRRLERGGDVGRARPARAARPRPRRRRWHSTRRSAASRRACPARAAAPAAAAPCRCRRSSPRTARHPPGRCPRGPRWRWDARRGRRAGSRSTGRARGWRRGARPARHQTDVEAGVCQPRRVVPADRPRSHDRELHVGHRRGILDRTRKCRQAGQPLFARRPWRRSVDRCVPCMRACTTATRPIAATDCRGGRCSSRRSPPARACS